jgi:hypothetical protein
MLCPSIARNSNVNYMDRLTVEQADSIREKKATKGDILFQRLAQ